MLLTLLFACASDPGAVCARGRDAAAACDDAFAVPDTCTTAFADCEAEDLERWYAYYDCYAQSCAEGTAYGDDRACSEQLEGVSWGCNPAGDTY